MVLGVISDTHDNLRNIVKAMQIFKEKSVKYIIHCGDVTSAVNYFDGVKVKFILGNCDNIASLEGSIKYGHEFLGPFAEIKEDNKLIAVYHGMDETRLNDLIKSKKYDFILTGHTHIISDVTIGKTRIINPGSHKRGENNIVILDPKKNIAEFIIIGG